MLTGANAATVELPPHPLREHRGRQRIAERGTGVPPTARESFTVFGLGLDEHARSMCARIETVNLDILPAERLPKFREPAVALGRARLEGCLVGFSDELFRARQ